MKAQATASAGINAGITAQLNKDGLTVEALARAEASFAAGATFGDIVSAGVLAKAEAQALARAIVNKDGLTLEAKAEASAAVDGNFDVYFAAGGAWTTTGSAGVRAEATANATLNKDGWEASTGAHAGAYAEAGTKLGTDRSHIGVSVSAGGAAGAGASSTAHIDRAKESLTLGGCVDGMLGIGATIC